MSKKINIRPTTSVYATYKNINYQIWNALAEFIDNSTQSYYSNATKLKATKYWKGLQVTVEYRKDPNLENEYILVIEDNAFGMDFNDFKRAIILDSKPTNITRSEFGMGLKTAACWFGLIWSVESTQLGNPVKYKAIVDVEHLSKYQNEYIDVEESSCGVNEHYTIIKIWKLNRAIKGRSISKTKQMLASMYRHDFKKEDISLFYNDEKLNYEDPEIYSEIVNNSTNIWMKEFNFKIEHHGKEYSAYGNIAIRKRASTTEAGFTLFRKGRVIVGGPDSNYRPSDIFGNSNSFEWQRLFGEIHMDDWPVVQTKDNFDWNNGLEDIFIEKMKSISSDYVKKAKDIRVRPKVNVTQIIEDTVKEFQNKGVISEAEISEYSVFTDNANVVNNVNLESSEFGSELDNSINITDYTPKKVSFKILDIDYIFNLKIDEVSEDQNWLKIKMINGNEYDIIWFMKHPFFKKFIDNPEFIAIMQKFIFAFAISEINILKLSSDEKVDPTALRTRMNSILKEVT
jgi:hypothetical protein